LSSPDWNDHSTKERNGRSFGPPPFEAIIGTILTIVAWLAFILLYALLWSKGYDLFQDFIVTIGSFLIMGLAIGLVWLAWLRMNGQRRSWKYWEWDDDDNDDNNSNRAEFRKSRRRRSRGGNNNNEYLSISQRGGEFVRVFFGVLVLGFFLYHQYANTGFFTSKFGDWEMFAFYGSMLLSFVPPIARAAIGSRNPVRPIEAFCNLFSAFAALYLFSVFPFNFANLTAALPSEIRFMFTWVDNDIGKVVLVLIFIGSLASGLYNIARYFFHPRMEKESRPPTPPPEQPAASPPTSVQ
jgi:hypothetical protein